MPFSYQRSRPTPIRHLIVSTVKLIKELISPWLAKHTFGIESGGDMQARVNNDGNRDATQSAVLSNSIQGTV